MTEDCVYKKYEPLFGSWYITKKIGEGAVARVYEMERRELGVTYHAALKAITIPESEDEVRSVMADGMTGADLTHYYETIVQNVVSEFQFMSRLKGHTNIVSYEDHRIIEHEDDIGWDILMRIELLTPLIEHSLEHRLDEADVLRLGIDICRALEYCRSFDILHRDVKPENIFVAPGGAFKLGDFGIAKVVEETRVGLSRKGTYKYMAPEVYKGGAYGPSTDIYSLGMVMYKYLNDGRDPFMPRYPQQVEPDDYDEAFARRIRGDQMQEPAYGSKRLKRLILKACAYDPKARFRSAAEFRQELEALQRKEKGLPRLWNEEAKAGPAQTESAAALQNDPAGKADEDGLTEAGYPAEGRFLHRTPDPSRRKKIIGRVAAVTAAVLFIAAGIVDYIIPDRITDIKGIGASQKIYIGEEIAPDYVIEPDWFRDEPVSFAVEDDSIASVDQKGRIKANALGKTTLTVSARDYEEKVTVDVVPKVTEIEGADEDLRIEEGDEHQLEITLKPEKFSDEPITYTSADSDVISVDEDGTLTAKDPGETTVTISAGGCTKKLSVEVYEYVAPTVVYRSSGSSRFSGSSGASHSSGSSSGGSGSSGKSSGGYFKSGDDEYF